MKAGSSTGELVVDQSDFVIPSYGWREASCNHRALASHERRSRLEKCIARRSELESEHTRTAAELSRTQPPGMRLKELSPEMRCLLRRLGALAIELAEIDREIAILTGNRDNPGQPSGPPSFSGIHAR